MAKTLPDFLNPHNSSATSDREIVRDLIDDGKNATRLAGAIILAGILLSIAIVVAAGIIAFA